jgi:dsRNA-specific ribonuclease
MDQEHEIILKNVANFGIKKIVSKTPVSFLGEICAKTQLSPPVFEFASESGESHKKNFAFKCIFGGKEFIGTSRCKQQAKQNSALEVLRGIYELPDLNNNGSSILKSYLEL